MYMVFTFYDYYPAGGMHDYVNSAVTLEVARQIAHKSFGDTYQIVQGTQVIEEGRIAVL